MERSDGGTTFSSNTAPDALDGIVRKLGNFDHDTDCIARTQGSWRGRLRTRVSYGRNHLVLAFLACHRPAADSGLPLTGTCCARSNANRLQHYPKRKCLPPRDIGIPKGPDSPETSKYRCQRARITGGVARAMGLGTTPPWACQCHASWAKHREKAVQHAGGQRLLQL